MDLKTFLQMDIKTILLIKCKPEKDLYELVEYEKYNSLDEKIYNFSTEGHE